MNKKVAIVTGASSGIGKAFAFDLAKLGYQLVINARSAENLAIVEQELNEQYPDTCHAIAGDVALESTSEQLVNYAKTELGRLDLFIANAGGTMKGLFTEVQMDVHRKLMDINYFGTLYAAHYALPELMKTHGSFVGVSSVAGFKGLPGRTGYSASKHAINGLIDTLQTEFLKLPVHIMLACPGFTNTNTRKAALLPDGTIQGDTPREEGKMMSAEDASAQILDAMLKKKKRIVLTREGKLILLLNKLAPEFLRKKIYQSFANEPNSPLPK